MSTPAFEGAQPFGAGIVEHISKSPLLPTEFANASTEMGFDSSLCGELCGELCGVSLVPSTFPGGAAGTSHLRARASDSASPPLPGLPSSRHSHQTRTGT